MGRVIKKVRGANKKVGVNKEVRGANKKVGGAN